MSKNHTVPKNVYCSVKNPVACKGIGYFRYVDKGGGEIVVCEDHMRMYQNIEISKAYKEHLLSKDKKD